MICIILSPFSKIRPAGGSTPANPLLEDPKTVRRIIYFFEEGVIFQNSDPPEAALLLNPCLKTEQMFGTSSLKMRRGNPYHRFFMNEAEKMMGSC